MKRLALVALFILAVLVLVQKPKFWDVFYTDRSNYPTDTFYYIIKEEYREDNTGKRVYQDRFTDIQNGDILVTDSTYCFCFRHGHAALVVDARRGVTLEAFGLGTSSEYSGLNEWRRYPHVLVLRLSAPKMVRDAVAEFAQKELRGIPYRISPGMIDDKHMAGEYWGTQCAHLVWAAFFAQGYDIDGNGGWLVTPEDFTKSDILQIVPQK